MKRYPKDLIKRVRELRSIGKTYSEIRNIVGIYIPKSTLSSWCQNIALPSYYQDMINSLNLKTLGKARAIAAAANKLKKIRMLHELDKINSNIAEDIERRNTAKIALSMLCLGEASKSVSGGGFYLGNSDPRIVVLFLNLLKKCFDFDMSKVRCTVQCRADQNISMLESYWQKTTGIPKEFFYKSRIDPRTVGKPTLKKDYKGVLKVDYFDQKVRFDLESLADLVYNQVF